MKAKGSHSEEMLSLGRMFINALRWSELNCSVEYLLHMRPKPKHKLISLSTENPPDGFYRYDCG